MKKQPWWKGSHGEWYVIFQFIYFGWIVLGPRNLPGLPTLPSWGAVLGLGIGGILIVLGGGLSFWGLLALGRNLSALPHPLEHATLVIKGPYRFVRHPIYSGLILGAIGWALLVQGLLTLLYALGLLLFFDLKTRREEKMLVLKFSAYAEYQRRVRKLVPFLY